MASGANTPRLCRGSLDFPWPFAGGFFYDEGVFMKRTLLALAGIILASALVVLAGCQLGGAEEPRKNLTRPYISVQPESRSFYVTDDIAGNALQLTVEIWDWVSADGDISYQWYTFEDIEEYCTEPVGGTAINGANGASYMPSGISPEAGKTYYYYVVVTNNNGDALDITTASTQSEVAAISFSAAGDPLAPIIVRKPANASYRWGSELNPLKVEARLPVKTADGALETGASLSYQWYSSGDFNVSGGIAIEIGGDQSSFIPSYELLSLGENYSFVEVKNTIGAKTATAVSIPAIVEMRPGVRAAQPRIEEQPKGRLYFTGDEIDPLTVTAVSPDMGDLSYQWYSDPTPNTYNNPAGGNAIQGQTGASYTPPAEAGNVYYYVIVTNTNQVVEGETTATAVSKAVQVRVADSAAGTETFNATVTIPDPAVEANRRQYVRGFGGMDVAWGNFPRTSTADTELMYDPDRLGYNILRIMIMPQNIDIEKTMADLIVGDRPDYYNNVKIVNKYGGYVAASPWSPPKEWKSNNSINGGGNLIPAYYRLFATYLRNFSQHMYDNGAPIYCISISNEPNYVAGYDGCEWTPEEMRDFWLECGHFTDGVRGYGGGNDLPYVRTMNGESANTPFINRSALQNPQSRAVIDLLARHIYGSRTDSLYNENRNLLERPDGTLTEVWMTEHNINSANATGYYNDSTWNYVWRFLNDVDLVMRINNENAFVWWASKRFYSMVGDGQFGTTDGAPLPRGWALSHYSRYTIDTTRLNLGTANITGTTADGTPINAPDRANSVVNNHVDDLDNTSPRITAYVSADGNEISLVLWTPTLTTGLGGRDMGTIKIDFSQVPGFEVKGVTAHRSNSSQLFQPENILIGADRKSAYITLPRGELLSVKFTK